MMTMTIMKIMKMMSMLLLLCFFIPSSQAVTCYACDSRDQSECADPMQCKCTTETCEGDLCEKTSYGDDGLLTNIHVF